MLINKPKQTPYIAVLRLTTGEEIVCKVVEETAMSYVVSKPLTLGQTAQGVQFVPFMMLADSEKHIVIPKPVIYGEVPPKLESQYESITSGIALPEKSSIITN